MKKTLSLVLSLVMVLSVLTAIPFTAHAITEYSYTQDSSLGGNTFRYTLSGNEATITGFTALSAGTTDKSITIPSIMNGNTVVEIGEGVFDGNENIESVSIPASVKTINSYAFNLCFGLSSVTFASDSELITIGEAAFASTAISSITLPSKLQYITENAFEYCENLTSVTIPNSTKTIFGGAFANCTNLSTVTIGSKVSDIKSGAFTGCVALSSISVDSANETYSSASGVLYNKDKTTLILYPQGKSNTGFELRDETTTIADYAFEGNTALQQLLINSDSSLVSIGVGAFRGCSSLKSIMDIPDSLTTIGDEAFKGVANNLYVQSACDHPLVASAIIQGVSTRTWDMNHSGKGQYTVNENVVPATCTEDGTYDEVVRCSGCDTEFSRTARTVDELGHDYNDVLTAPTCTEQGYTMYTCSRCDDSYIGNYVDALGHTEVIDKAVAATCTKTGLTQGSHCSVCGTVITAQKTVDELGHDYNDVLTAPTCTEQGYTMYTCSRCDDSYIGNYVDALGHTEVIDKAVAATCTKTGLTQGSHCSVCGTETVKQISVPKLTTHTYGSDNKCTVCGEEKPGTGGETTPDPGTTPGTGGSTGDSSGGGTTPDPGTAPGTGTTPDTDGVSGGGNVVTPAPTPTPTPTPGTGATPGAGGSDATVTPTPTPTPGTGDGTGSTPEVTPTPDAHQHSYVKTITKATAKKDGSIVEKCACGDVKSSVVIKKASKIKLSKSSYVYTGKVIKTKNLPKVIVKDSAGKTIAASNYTIVKPKNVKKMKALGKYAYTVKFKGGKYKGTVKVYLEITPAKVTAKAPKAAKKAVTVTWKKGKKAQVTGYQVTVATDKKFTKNVKTKKIKGYSKTSCKMTKLKAKKTYYVKVRAYKVTKTGTVYGPWSVAKSAKIK